MNKGKENKYLKLDIWGEEGGERNGNIIENGWMARDRKPTGECEEKYHYIGRWLKPDRKACALFLGSLSLRSDKVRLVWRRLNLGGSGSSPYRKYRTYDMSKELTNKILTALSRFYIIHCNRAKVAVRQMIVIALSIHAKKKKKKKKVTLLYIF